MRALHRAVRLIGFVLALVAVHEYGSPESRSRAGAGRLGIPEFQRYALFVGHLFAFALASPDSSGAWLTSTFDKLFYNLGFRRSPKP
jgi:hypothetical protein